MIKKFYYKTSPEYYIYYTVNDGYPVEVDTSGWPEVVRNEMVSAAEGRLVFNTVPIYIPDDAFYSTSSGGNLTSITIPSTITYIGEGAFTNCQNLTSFTLPDTVTSMGVDSFYGTGISTPIYNSTLFAHLPNSYSGSYTIPSGITKIIGYAAYDCPGLTSLIIPNSVTEIGQHAFNRCDNLTRVEIGSGITNIGTYAFLSMGANGTFICRAIDPPDIDTSLGSPGAGWTLYVPANSVSAYQSDSKWANVFSSIQAIQN